ncbi:hypothetical protein ACLDZE_07145 [Acinetobacter baumannii]
MDNYKIKVKDEAESKEAQELFFDLGYELRDSKRDITNLDATHIYADDGVLTFGFNDFNFRGSDNEELTLPQLRDLVVLKRNDINDANWETEGGDQIFNDSNNKSYIYRTDGWDELQRHEMRQAMWEKSKAIAKPQDPALISGADALRALADGKEVEFKHDTQGWVTCLGLNIERVLGGWHQMRLKPQTIKLELEIPAPCKAKIGGRDDASFVLNVGRHQYCYNNEEDYTKARDALEAVFDSAVRGTNS